jgi:hypothetical protein
MWIEDFVRIAHVGNAWEGWLMLSSCLFPCLDVRCVSPMFAVIRRRCCTSKRCTAVCSAFGKEHYLCQSIACEIGGPSCQKCPVYGRYEQIVYHSPGEKHSPEFQLRCKFKGRLMPPPGCIRSRSKKLFVYPLFKYGRTRKPAPSRMVVGARGSC